MKLDHKGLAILSILMGCVMAGGYLLGVNQGSGNGSSEASSEEAAKTADAGVVKSGTIVPPDHPVLESSPGVGPGPESGKLNDSKFSHFRVGNRNVKGLYIDGHYVWIGSSGGVIRYDTMTDEYKVFDNRVDGILSNGVFHVSKLGDGIVVGTYGGGLSMLDPETDQWRNINIPDGLADQFVYDVQKTSKGDVWIATWSGANFIEDGDLSNPSKWKTFTVENTDGGIPNPWIYGVEEGKNGVMWFATEEGLARYKDGKWVNWQHDDGLGADYELVKDSIKSTNDPASASKHHAQQKSDQGLQNIKVAYNPNYIISLEIDEQGIVWCGTWGGGLARFDGETWRNYTTHDGLPGNHIFMLYLDPDGVLWAGTSQGLAKLNDDGETFTVMTTRDGLFANNVFSMAKADDGTMWVGSFGGVARIAASSK